MTNSPILLNLDDLATQPTKRLVIKGKPYDSVTLTVQGYVDRIKTAKQIDADYKTKRDSGNFEERELQIDQMIDLLVATYERLDRKVLQNMTLDQLNAAISFTLAAPEDIAEKVKEQGVREDDEGNA